MTKAMGGRAECGDSRGVFRSVSYVGRGDLHVVPRRRIDGPLFQRCCHSLNAFSLRNTSNPSLCHLVHLFILVPSQPLRAFVRGGLVLHLRPSNDAVRSHMHAADSTALTDMLLRG